MKLHGKIAVIYGGGGAIGGAVAGAFGAEGARVFLAGRHRTPLEAVADGIVAAGGSAEIAEVDALDERAVDEHLATVVDQAGGIDVSFNAIGIPNPKDRAPLVDIDLERFSLPIATYTTSYFLTARLAARRMVRAGSGVIMTVTSTPSRNGVPFVGGAGAAMAAVEALTRGLSSELAPYGVRVVGLRPQGSDQGELRVLRRGLGDDLGSVPRCAREQDPYATTLDARGAGQRGGFPRVRRGERHDGDDREPGDGKSGRLRRKNDDRSPDHDA